MIADMFTSNHPEKFLATRLVVVNMNMAERKIMAGGLFVFPQ